MTLRLFHAAADSSYIPPNHLSAIRTLPNARQNLMIALGFRDYGMQSLIRSRYYTTNEVAQADPSVLDSISGESTGVPLTVVGSPGGAPSGVDMSPGIGLRTWLIILLLGGGLLWFFYA